MAKRTRVAVYGNSLPMASIAASLKAEPALEVVSIRPGSFLAQQILDESDASSEVSAHGLPAREQEQRNIHPDVIIFDSQAMQPELRQLLAADGPGTLLIGVDVSSNEMLVLRGYTAQALNMADLVSLIMQKDPRSEGGKKTGRTV